MSESTSASIDVPEPPRAVPTTDPTRDKLGRYSMYLAIAVLALSLIASILIGVFGTTIYHYDRTVIVNGQSSSGAGFNAAPDQIAFLAQFTLGTIFGIGAIVLGIIATVQKRGRAFGIAAIVIAVVAPVFSLIVWAVLGLIFGHHIYPPAT